MSPHLRRGALALCSLAAVAAAVTVGAGGASAGPGDEAATLAKQHKSALLVAAGDLRFAPDTSYYEGMDAIRAAAAPLEEAVPLPDGGNFNGIRWSEVDGVHVDDILFTLQFNASCQWYRALADGREVGTARRVLAEMPSWPAFRGQSTADLARRLAGADADSELFQLKLAECAAQHQREVSFARAHGLQPPR